MSSVPTEADAPGWMRPAVGVGARQTGKAVPLIRPGALAEHGKSTEESLAREWALLHGAN